MACEHENWVTGERRDTCPGAHQVFIIAKEKEASIRVGAGRVGSEQMKTGAAGLFPQEISMKRGVGSGQSAVTVVSHEPHLN